MSKAWPTVQLAEVIRHRKEFITIDDTVTYRRPRVQLHAQGIVLRDAVPGALIKTKQQQVCRDGDFLVAEIDAKVGGFGIVPDSLDGAIVSSHYFLFDIDDAKLDRRYLDYFVRTPAFRGQVEAQGSTNYAAIRPSHVLAYTLPLPPLAEQRRVVARVEELAKRLSEVRELKRQTTDEMKALSSAAIDAVRNRHVAAFGATTLGTACASVTDGDHNTPSFTDDGIRFIFVGNVSAGSLHFESSKRVSDDYFHSLSDKRVPKRGDILYSAVGATLGIPAIVETDEPFCFQRHIAILKPDTTKIAPRYLWYMLRSGTVFRTAWASTTGSAQPTIPLRAIRELPVPLAPLDDQRRAVASLDRIEQELTSLATSQAAVTAELDALLPAILYRAFNGQLG